ncbi:glycosyltransferase family 9 protein [Sphingobacterium sp. SRCM116780]|uniref:glycosyltransferase family 9 protein n=1 Tax=Sphingobacterium sp. SRCM116780 TaxID=2907623 RepID=UPI001F350D86|nr:glycosyltransferase family 9 protein [Sphingobacterium sp. SRCM116780]UIR56310.1 glycosyltransferase family 9 protein [Sphingobacterium sp. SRCM116780]
MKLPSKIIVTRFSAMGDVAMVASVLKDFVQQYPNVSIVMVSRPLFQAFFEGIPNVQFHPFYPKDKHKGLKGIIALKKELTVKQADAVADLHFNLRSRVLATLFRCSGLKVKQLDKGRKEKKALTRQQNRILKQLKPTVERYADVFRALGFEFELQEKLRPLRLPLPNLAYALFANDQSKKIGISPFAQHPYKVFPLGKMQDVMLYLSQNNYDIYIFGGGKIEQDQAEKWQSLSPNIHSTIGRFKLKEELAIISNLDLMISMDSSGMHLASLMGIRCLSIWGATHPFAGFLGYGQSIVDCVQVDHPHRPNSIYGNKPCDCDGKEAIDLVTSEMIISKINQIF